MNSNLLLVTILFFLILLLLFYYIDIQSNIVILLGVIIILLINNLIKNTEFFQSKELVNTNKELSTLIKILETINDGKKSGNTPSQLKNAACTSINDNFDNNKVTFDGIYCKPSLLEQISLDGVSLISNKKIGDSLLNADEISALFSEGINSETFNQYL